MSAGNIERAGWTLLLIVGLWALAALVVDDLRSWAAIVAAYILAATSLALVAIGHELGRRRR